MKKFRFLMLLGLLSAVAHSEVLQLNCNWTSTHDGATNTTLARPDILPKDLAVMGTRIYRIDIDERKIFTADGQVLCAPTSTIAIDVISCTKKVGVWWRWWEGSQKFESVVVDRTGGTLVHQVGKLPNESTTYRYDCVKVGGRSF